MVLSVSSACGPPTPVKAIAAETSEIFTLERSTYFVICFCSAVAISSESAIRNSASSRHSRKFASILPLGEQWAP